MNAKQEDAYVATLNDTDKMYTLKDLWEAFMYGENNMDADGCQIDDEPIAFEEIVERLKQKSIV